MKDGAGPHYVVVLSRYLPDPYTWGMGILQKIKRSFLRLDCQSCGVPLAEYQRDTCSDECGQRAEEWNAHR